MRTLTTIDRRLIAALKQDARVSVTTLAALLNVSRATVQTRMESLIADSIIQRFTVDVDASVDSETVKAVMLIELEGPLARSVIATLQKISEISSLHTTNGGWDLVAHIETVGLAEFDQLLRRIREVKGVLNSETNILLNRAGS